MLFLDEMALFVEVVDAKSFSKAAEKLNVPKSTLSVRINKLEQHIGLRLLNRTTRKIELTEAGSLYYERAKNIVQEAYLAHQQLENLLENPSGILRVSLPVDMAYQSFAPLVPEFCEKYANIQLDIDVTPRKVDLISEPFDVVVRVGELENSNLISRLLITHQAQLYVAPLYLAKKGTPQTLAELTSHQCLRFRSDEWVLSNGTTTERIKLQGQVAANGLGMIQRFAIAGLGIALLPDIVAKTAVQSGELIPLFPDWKSPKIPVYALTATRLLPAKTQVFIAFLKEKLGG